MSLRQQLGGAAPRSGPSDSEKMAAQKRTFTNWVNVQLRKNGPSARSVSNLVKDFEDGALLIQLLENLSGGKKMPGAYYKEPRTNIQRTQNLTIAFRFMTNTEKIPLPSLGPRDLLKHRLQPILDLLWAIFLHYNLDCPLEAADIGQRQREAKRLLIQWLRGTLPDRNISNLTTDWSDGVNISALVNSCRPGLLSKYASLNRNKGDRNVQKAMDLAHSKLGVPQVLEATDMAAESPDERCIVIYLSYFSRIGQTSLSDWASRAVPAVPGKVKVVNIHLPEEPGTGTKLAWIEIDCSEAGHGFVRGEALGSKGEKVVADVEATEDDMYRVQFPLSQPDLYQASIFYGEGNIPGSPFSINMLPPDADRVQHLGTQMPEAAGDPVALAFNTKEAGRGKLSAQATNEAGDKIDVDVEQNLDGTFKVLFVPPEADIYTVDVNWGVFSVQGEDLVGNELRVDVLQKPDCDCRYSFGVPTLQTDTYKVTVLWEGKPVPGSPFQIDLLLPAKPENAETGMPIFTDMAEPMDIPIDVSEAGSGTVTADCMGELSGEVPVKISGPRRNPYMVSFTPQQADLYTLSILFNGAHMGNSPMALDLRQGTLKIHEEPDKGPEEKVPVMEEMLEAVPTLVEETVPEGIVEEKEASPGLAIEEDRASLSSVSSSSSSSSEEGEVRREAVSPPPLESRPPQQELTTIVGRTVKVKVQALGPDRKRGKVTANATGDRVGPTNVKISKKRGGISKVKFSPSEADRYVLDIRLNRECVPKTPVLITYLDPSKCKILGRDALDGRLTVEEPINLSVDTRGAGRGELQVTPGKVPAGEKDVQIQVRPREDEPEIYDVTYTPHVEGSHSLDFHWSGYPIPDSPVKFKVREDERVQTYLHGHPISLDLDSESRPSELKAHAVHEDTNTQYKVKVAKAQRGKFKLSFQPKDPGLYRVHILAKDKPISGSPLLVRYGRPPKPEAITVHGLEDKCYVNEPCYFTIDCSEAGSGELGVRATAPKAKKDKSELKLNDNKDGSFQVEYTPVSLGDHSFAVTWSGVPAPGSPYHTTVVRREPEQLTTDASKCFFVGLDKLPNLLQLEKEIAFMVNASNAGPGELHESIECPDQDEPPKLQISPDKSEKNVYHVRFTPTAPGMHRLHFNWGGEEIPHSPLCFDIADIQTVPNGKPMGVEFGADCKPGDIQTYAIHEETNTKYKVKVAKVPKGKFKLSLEPQEPGVYAVHVLIKNKEISGSPFRIRYGKPPQPENCKVLDFPEKGQVGHYLNFTIDARDAGSGELGIRSVCPSTTEKPHLSVANLKNKTFKVEYIPNVAGDHQFHITWNGQPVPGSPYQVPITESQEYAAMEWRAPAIEEEPSVLFMDTIGLESGAPPEKEHKPTELTTVVGKVLKVKVQPQADRLGKELVATVKGDSTGEGNIRVVETSDGNYVLSFNPSLPDRYVIDVTLDNEPVPKTPIIATFVPPPSDATKVRLLGVEDIPVSPLIDQPVFFQVDVREGGTGSLGIVAKPPQLEPRPKIEVKASKDHPRIIDVHYTPNTAGLHSIELQWAKEDIPGSPITLPVSEPQKEESLEDTMASFLMAMPPRIDWEEPVVSGVGEPVDLPLMVDTKPGSQLTATCSGEDTGDIPVRVSSTSPTKHKFSFTPPAPDLYTIHAFQNGEEIRGSPYTIDLRQKVRPPSFIEEGVEQEIATVEESAPDIPLFPMFDSPLEEEEEETVVEDDQKVQPMEEIPAYIGRSLLVKVKPQLEEQGKGDLIATATGEQTGPVDITVSKKSDALFLITFNPTKPDRYTIEAKLNDKHIPRSPFIVNYRLPPPDASKCRILGLNDLPEVLEVDNEIPLLVDATRAGEGILDVHVDGPTRGQEPPKLEVNPTESDPAKFNVSYLPTAPGTHTINLQWSDQHIPASPVKLIVVDMASVETHAFGVPIGIDVDADCKPSELKAYAIHEGNRTPLKVKATRVKRGKYKLSFSPSGYGLYYIHVLARDKDVRGSPFVVRIAEPPKPEAVKVEGLTNRGYVGEPVKFTINGTNAGSGEPSVKALGPGQKERGTLTVEDNKDRTYAVEYTPSAPGKHQFQVSWARKAVPGSPFPLQVRERADEELFVDLLMRDRVGSLYPVELPAEGAPLEISATTDKALVWKIKARTEEQMKGDIVATATGDRVGPAEVKVSKPSAETFEILFTPPEPDHYTIEGKLNEKPVPLTPLAVNYTTPSADASLVKIIGLENVPSVLQVQKEIPFKVDTRLAGDGKLNVSVDTPEGEKEPPQLQVSEDEPHIYGVRYVPTVPGSHRVKLGWGEESIPVNLDVIPIPTFPFGKTAEMDIKAPGKVGDTTAYAIDVDSGTQYKVKVHKVQKGNLRFSFEPKAAGIYELHILHKKKEIPGSPFYVRVLRPGGVALDKVLVDIPRMPEGPRGPAVVALDTRDAGRSKVTAKCVDRTGEDVPVAIKEKRPDIYVVRFDPPKPEIYTLNVQYGGQEIEGSPFTIDTLHPDATKITVTEPDKVELGQPVHYLCDAHMAGPGELTATCRGDDCGEVPVKITTEDKAHFDVSYVPERPDHYRLKMDWSGESVPNSPFSLNLLPSAPEKVEVIEPEIPAEAGLPMDLPVDLTQAGVGMLTAKCVGEYYGEVPVHIEKKQRNRHKIKFIPPGEDLYTLSLYLDDVEVKGSPQIIDMRKTKPPPRPVTPELEEAAVMEEAVMVESGGPALWEFPPGFEPQEPEEEEPQKPPEEITNYIGKELVLDVEPEEEGGNLTATAVGDKVGQTDILVKKVSNKHFKVLFNPDEPDRYTIEVKLNESDIPGSPFIVNYLQPPPGASECRIIGLDDLPEIQEVDREIPLVVDATRAGEGVLEVGIDGPTRDQEPPRIEVKPTEEEPARYNVRYVPTAPGTHNLDFKWSDQHIPDSPVRLFVVDMAAVETHAFGAPVGIDIESDCKPSELKAHAIQAGTSTLQKVKVAKAGKGKYKLSFTPTGHGLYYIHVLARDKDVQGSPFILQIAEPPKPEAVKVEGLTDKGYVGEPVKFTINGTNAGSGEPSVKALGPGQKERGTLTVEDNKDRTYAVEYTPSVPGKHQFQVSWARKAVPGSPFPLQVRERADEELFVNLLMRDRVGSFYPVELPAEGAPLEVSATTDKALVWKIKARTEEQMKGDIVATATGDRVGPAEVKVSKPSAETFEILFTPPEPDRYTIEGKLNEKPVPLTPLAVNYTTPSADASLVKIIGLENIPPNPQVEREIPFKVDTRLAGDGKLNVSVDTPEGEKEPPQLQVSEDEPHIYSVRYVPTVPGSHTVKLGWGEESIPVNFDVSSVQLHPHGKPVALDISTEAKQGDLDSYALHVDTAAKYKVRVHKVQKGRFKLNFQPKEPGLYAVHVLAKKKDIMGSPFYIRYNKPADASACVVRGLDTPVHVHEKLNFVIDCSEAGTGDLGIGVSGPQPLEDGQVSIADNHNGTFSGVFEPHVPGEHVFNITWSGKSVPGSPFTVDVAKRVTDDWKKCFIPEEDLAVLDAPLMAGGPIDFSVLGKDAGDGEITAFIDGPEKRDVRVINNRDGTFSCRFSLEEPGRYNLSILWDGTHIRGSPFALYVKPSPTLKGVDLEGQRFQTGLPQNFAVNCAKVGEGVLEVRCDPPTAGDVRIMPSAEQPSCYSCQLLPKETGDCKVLVMYNGMHIQGSPYNVHFTEPSAANMTFSLSGEGIDTSDMSATLESTTTSQEIPITLSQLLGGGQFGLQFNPTQGLEYTLTLRCRIKIKMEEQSVQGSPFMLEYTSDAAQCIARGEGLSTAESGKWNRFRVDTTSAGEGELTVDIHEGADKPEVSISRTGQHQYEVSYLPAGEGTYHIAVYWGGQHITGSPFTVQCTKPKQLSLQVSQVPTTVMAGQPIEFEVKAEGMEGELAVSAMTPSGETVSGNVIPEESGTYKCVILTPEVGLYNIDLFYDKRKVLDTPIQVTVQP